MISEKYDPKGIEGKWQKNWDEKNSFTTLDPSKDPLKRPKYYCLCMFPYPSGAIHMGHARNYSIGDAFSRYKRKRGFNVLQPMGWDAFGLPAENAAIQRGVHPEEWTLKNIEQMKTELRAMGFSYDWDREVKTCLPEYYKFEQNLFRQFFKKGLAFKKEGVVNWCEQCQTVLANEQVQDGKCWRCDGEVIMRNLSQWYFKITNFSQSLLDGHDELKGHWPDRVIDMQKHWIGKSQGCTIFFQVEGSNEKIQVFTTRADTLFGVTFVTLSPFHPLLAVMKATPQKNLIELKEKSLVKDRSENEKNGFFTGHHCLHPLTGEKIPIWVGDFVVMEYGTGAVMGVPAHDERDFEFAKKYGLPIKEVIKHLGEVPTTLPKNAFVENGVLVESGEFSRLTSDEAKIKISMELQKKGLGEGTIQYKLRDWGISRQRYWGAPIPIIYCDDCGPTLVPENDLPVKLPLDVKFTGQGGNPLSKHPSFVKAECPTCGKLGGRETDTFDTFMESSWYYLRYTDPKNLNEMFSTPLANSWLPVDTYIGGIEHACMHLLYARFFHKVLKSWGYVSTNEPFKRLITQGMVIKDGSKMSKSKGNIVTPSSIIEKYGADTARLFMLFQAPPEKDLEWSDQGIEGSHRYLHRVWRLFNQFEKSLKKEVNPNLDRIDNKLLQIRRKTHFVIKKITFDLEEFKFNTAIAVAMELVNEIYGLMADDPNAFDSDEGIFVLKEALYRLLHLLNPFVPHLTEELWSELGQKGLLSLEPWPSYDEELLKFDTFTLVVQINGKLREKIDVSKLLKKEEIQKLVLELPKIKSHLGEKSPRQFIYVPGRLANIVV